jgi:DNA mismatch endonuclease (patch repair protein)
MTDTVCPKTRSWIMSQVKSKDTKPEIRVRSMLHAMGFRFRLQRKDLPGRPDITLPKYKTVVFVHGCFWHRHLGCKKTTTPATRVQFWQEKFRKNVERDERSQRELAQLGWTVIVVWECELRDEESLTCRLEKEIRRSGETGVELVAEPTEPYGED